MNRAVLLLVGLFLVTNALGLQAATELQQQEPIQDTAEEHQSASSGVMFFLMIGAATALMLLLYKYNARRALKAWLGLALFITTLIFFDAFMPPLVAGTVALALVTVRFYTDHMLAGNVVTMFSFAGAGAFFGSVIGYRAAVVFIIVVAIYDYISVNVTGHMKQLAKSGMSTDTFMGFTYPKDDGGVPVDEMDAPDAADEDMDTAETSDDAATPADGAKQQVGLLGGGDVVIPLAFAASLMPTFGQLPAYTAVGGAAVGLYLLLTKAQQGTFYPAIPPLAAGALLGAGIGVLLGNAAFIALLV